VAKCNGNIRFVWFLSLSCFSLFSNFSFRFPFIENILSRLTVINLTHEAKGLDTYQKSKEKFLSVSDEKSAQIIEKNYFEEINHVRIGVKWFQYICEKENINPIETFHELSRKHFKGKLKEPFNHEARETAGMSKEWYLPIAAQ
jgi:uncharacterized ferritin-like protein (DUF455 family)